MIGLDGYRPMQAAHSKGEIPLVQDSVDLLVSNKIKRLSRSDVQILAKSLLHPEDVKPETLGRLRGKIEQVLTEGGGQRTNFFARVFNAFIERFGGKPPKEEIAFGLRQAIKKELMEGDPKTLNSRTLELFWVLNAEDRLAILAKHPELQEMEISHVGLNQVNTWVQQFGSAERKKELSL